MNKLAAWAWCILLIIFFVGWGVLIPFALGIIVGLVVMFVNPKWFDKF